MIVLDTHVWVWLVSGERKLSAAAQAAIAGAERIGVSTVSVWEIGMLSRLGRIEFDRPVTEWVTAALGLGRIEALAPTPSIALAAGLLPSDGLPGDPADRLIYATARGLGVPLVTQDARLRAYDPRGTIWD